MKNLERILTWREKRDLGGKVFRDLDLVAVDLVGADLRGATFERVRLERCDLTSADLRGARFVLCVLREVVLSDAQLAECCFEGSSLHGIVGLSDEGRLAVVRGGGVELPMHTSLR